MKLTEEQIDLIDRYLEQKKLDFLDFKLEIRDHLATATEIIMEQKNSSFENSFVNASLTWEEELTLKKIDNKVFPSLIVNKIKKNILFQDFLITITAIFLAIFTKTYFDFYFEKHYFHFKLIIAFISFVYLFLRRIIIVNKIKTSFSYRFDYSFYPVLICMFYFFILKGNDTDTFGYFLGFSILVQFPTTILFFFKHQQFIKKYHLA